MLPVESGLDEKPSACKILAVILLFETLGLVIVPGVVLQVGVALLGYQLGHLVGGVIGEDDGVGRGGCGVCTHDWLTGNDGQ